MAKQSREERTVATLTTCGCGRKFLKPAGSSSTKCPPCTNN